MAFFDDIIDLTKHEFRNAVIQPLATDPASPVEGQVYYNTASKKLRQFNGTVWVEYGTGAGAGDVTQSGGASSAAGKVKVSAAASKDIVDSSIVSALLKMDASSILTAAVLGTDYLTDASTNVLTNKTFDANGTGNTLSNVETADLASGVLNTSSTLSGATATQLPSALAVSQAIASAISGVARPMGGIDCSANPNYPAANVGEYYRVTVAGRIGGASGEVVEVGDELHCFVTSIAGTQAAVGANWTVVQTNVDQATTTVLGLVALATNAEALAKSDGTKAVVPSALVGFTQSKAFTFGDGTATSFTLTHNLNTLDVIVQVRLIATNEVRYPNIVNATVNTVTISGFTTAPASNTMRAVIIG